MLSVGKQYGEYFDVDASEFDSFDYDWSDGVRILDTPLTPIEPKDLKPAKDEPVVIMNIGGDLKPIGIPANDFLDAQFTLPTPPETPAEEEPKLEFVDWLGNPIEAGKPIVTIKDVLETYNFSKSVSVDPRGLHNTRNTCFMNSVLQALVHCPPFAALMDALVNGTMRDLSAETPVLNALISFYLSYTTAGDLTRAFSPDEFYNCVCNTKGFHIEYNRQEDAQEFLSELMNGLEEDFKSLDYSPAPPRTETVEPQAEENDQWTEVGSNSKPIETMHAGHEDLKNPIQALFGGKFKSTLNKHNSKQPSVTTEPFQQVPLDITSDEIQSVQHALDAVFEPEHLNIDDQPAVKNLELQRAPLVLVAHLKRFTFQATADSYDVIKIRKPIIISSTLTLNCQNDTHVYEPFAVVYHHGTTVTSGHYTADVKTSAGWFRTDDHQVRKINVSEVLGSTTTDEESRSAYMVLYTKKP